MRIQKETIRKHIHGHGLEDQQYVHIRSSSNEIYTLEKDGYVMRFFYIGDKDHNSTIINNILAQPLLSISLWNISKSAVPSVFPTVKTYDGWLSTVWHKGNVIDDDTGYYMTQALKKLHSIDKNSLQYITNLSQMNIIDTINDRYRKVETLGIDREILQYLQSMIHDACYSHNIISSSGDNIIHLDTYGANLVEYHNESCLIDLDTMAIGPWQYDYVVYLLSSQLFGNEIDHSYIPQDVFSWDLYDMSVQLRKTDMFSWICTMSSTSDAHYEEMIKRYESLKYNTDYQWNKNL